MDLAQEASQYTHAKPPMPRVRLPIVIVGAGGIVRDAHLPAYKKAKFPVAVVVDSEVGKAEALARQFSVPYATASLAEALTVAPRDCVFDVAVPARYTADVVRQLPDGSAVLLQKPMGNTILEAGEILKLCQEKRLTAAVNFQLRYAPAILAAKEIMDNGLLGEIHDMQVIVNVHLPWNLWTYLFAAPRVEILYHSIHYIDLVRSCFGNPDRILAKTVKDPLAPEVATSKSVVILDFGQSKRAYISTNHNHLYPDTQASYVQWEGTKGMLRVTLGMNLDYPGGRPDRLEIAARGESLRSLPIEGNWIPDGFAGSMGSLQAYVNCDSTELPTRVEDAFETMRAVEAAYISSGNL